MTVNYERKSSNELYARSKNHLQQEIDDNPHNQEHHEQ